MCSIAIPTRPGPRRARLPRSAHPMQPRVFASAGKIQQSAFARRSPPRPSRRKTTHRPPLAVVWQTFSATSKHVLQAGSPPRFHGSPTSSTRKTTCLQLVCPADRRLRLVNTPLQSSHLHEVATFDRGDALLPLQAVSAAEELSTEKCRFPRNPRERRRDDVPARACSRWSRSSSFSSTRSPSGAMPWSATGS